MQQSVRKILFSVAVGRLKAPFKQLSSPRFQSYAEHHGFEYHEITEYRAVTHRDPKWIKVHCFLNFLQELSLGDLIAFLDADIAIVCGDIELTTQKSISLAIDSSGNLNSGVLAVRVNLFSQQFFEAIWNRTDCEKHVWQDNLAFLKVLDELSAEVKEQHIEILPNCLNTTLVTGEFLPYESKNIPNPCLEPIRFRHFAGGQPWLKEYFAQEIIFDNVEINCRFFPASKEINEAEKASIEATLQHLNLKEVNLVVFPDWDAPEQNLHSDLAAVIQIFSTHPEHRKTTLLIDTSDISEEDARLILSGVAMKLLMELDLDITQELEISLIGKLEATQWEVLLRRVRARVALKNENQRAIAQIRKQMTSFYPVLWTDTRDSLANS